MLTNKLRVIFILVIATFLLPDIITAQENDSLPYPIRDRRGDPFSWQSRNPFDRSDTSLIHREIQYDPVTKQYYILEKIGDRLYRTPTPLSEDEFRRLMAQQQETDYFNERARALDLLNYKQPRPKLRIFDDFFNRTFGVAPSGKLVDIRPQGNLDISLGYQGQQVNNPTISESARQNGGFDLKMNANVNMLANVGSKLTLPISYNTQSTFDFENQLKLNYRGYDDEIIKSIEAGNLSFQTKGTLIPSVQNLFGLKTQLQFGKLAITAALAVDRSQKQSITLRGGGLSQQINKTLDDYDENRNFLLAQYFKNHFNEVMSSMPVTKSQVQILRMEVWVTNRTGTTTNARSVVGLMDLGETSPYNSNIHALGSYNNLPGNTANDLYSHLSTSSGARNTATTSTYLQAMGLKPVDDFEKVYARKLDSGTYTYNPQVGFISLNQQLQSDDVLAVAFQYTYNGRVYQVGEFSQDVALDSTSGTQKVLFLKLLKATSQRIQLPIWQLMMKNVYSLDISGIDSSSFKLNVYYQEPGGGVKRYLPVSTQQSEGKPLLTLLNADRLNSRNDPQPDGQFDFINGYTVLSNQGKIIFPVLQPFGRDLDSLAFQGLSQDTKNKYIYYALYDSIKAIAQTYTNLNRYLLQGTVKGSSSSQISLGAMNIPQGSVIVTAGGQTLVENTDYTIDYNLGMLQILNQAILNSGLAINVQFENNTGLTSQQRNFMGLRLDYRANDQLALGFTMEKLSERPYFTKMSYGEDPINNTVYGTDINYHSTLPGLTRLLNKLPFYSTNAESNITAYGEGAVLKPGHPSQIGSGSQGSVYIDDFEGSNSAFDLRYPLTSWALASTPAGNGLFPEATLLDSIDYGMNRAKLAWYNIEPVLQDKNGSNNPLRTNLKELSDPRVRAVYENELFPQQQTTTSNLQTTTFDLSYYPTEKGPYNFTSRSSDLDKNGHLLSPKKRWGGIMRALSQTDFETNNIEYIEFWVQDPFINAPTSTGGKLIFNLGNVSEDILKDGKRFYENGMSTPTQTMAMDSSSTWGMTPVNPIQITNAFSNTASDRPYQDVGLDGLDDDRERRKRSSYLDDLARNFGTSSPVYQQALNDPSNDNYRWYRDESFTSTDGILLRYKNYNNPQGNSPLAGSSQLAPAATLYPDNEDLNGDNTLNETEEYFEYDINLKPNMSIGDGYLADIRQITPKLADGTSKPENWYLFRIPVKDFSGKVGSIADFKSLRFIRMYLTGFEDSVTLRFARLNLVRNQWRNFTYALDTTGNYTSLPNSSTTTLNTLSVNIQDNSGRQPIPYKMPPGVAQIQALANNGVNVLQNEQSMSLQVNDLNPGDARAVFKNMNLDMRRYGQLSMFIHAESVTGKRAVLDNELSAVIRIGQDYVNNFYEIRIPLKITQPASTVTPEQVWPDANELLLSLQDLVTLKLQRNNLGISASTIYRQTNTDGKILSVMGNPNLAEVQGFLIGVENTKSNQPLSTEVWVDELRLSQMDEKGGWAALGRVDMQLADLGSLSVSANTYSAGWGTIEQNTNERSTNSMKQFDAALNIDAGKLLPASLGFTIPVYASINKTVLTPLYDPYDQDVLYKTKLAMAKTAAERDSIRRIALDQTTIKTLNFTNVRFARPKGFPKLWSLSNFDFSYSYTSIRQSSPLVQQNNITRHHGGFGYTFNGQEHYYEPFRRLIKSKSPWLALIRDFNFNPVPSLLSFRADIDQQMGMYTPRIVRTYQDTSTLESVDTTYDKYFRFDRYYNLRWNLSRGLNLDFSAINNALVDQPDGLLNTRSKRDSVWRNFTKGGRTTMYQQVATLSYSLPLNKLPLTDWINARYSYSANYDWVGASLLATSLGNVIENGSQNNLTAELDFTRLYNKSRWLRLSNQPAQQNNNRGNNTNQPAAPPLVPKAVLDTAAMKLPPKAEALKGLHGRERRIALRRWKALRDAIRRAQKTIRDAAKPTEVNAFARTAGQVATLLKRMSVSYSTTYNSRIPGFMDDPKYIGQNWKTLQPGLGYIFGKQPNQDWLDKMAAKGVLTRDTLFNDMFRQSYTQHYSITAQIQPVRSLTIDLNLEKSFTKDYSELFKDTLGNGNYAHLSPYAAGGFSISYISFKTMFGKRNNNEASSVFNKFSAYRQVISQRLGVSNAYSEGTSPDGYAQGYGRYAQDVLIPAFIAAYTGKDPSSVPLLHESNESIKTNPFSGLLPRPNWRLTFTGLSDIPMIRSIFPSIAITHAYNATLGMNNFTSSLLYADPLHLGTPGFVDATSGNFVPFFLIPNLTIQEQFSPLIGINVTTTGQNNFNFQYSRSRQLSLSLVDYQVSEVNSREISMGASIRKRGVSLPFLPGSQNLNGGNDLNFTLNFSLRDDQQSNSILDQASSFSTGGQKVISISPSLDYVLNRRINLKIYFDQQRIKPYISTSVPITTTTAGIQIRVSLAQ